MTKGRFVSYRMLILLCAGAILISALTLGSSYYVVNEIGTAFCLGAFSVAVSGVIGLFIIIVGGTKVDECSE